MNKGIYITTTGPFSGKTIVALGLMHVLLGKTQKVGFFRPIIKEHPHERDNNIETILDYFKLPQRYEESYAFTGEQVIRMRNEGRTDEMIDRVISRYKQLDERFDVMLVEGSDFLGEGVAFEFDINASIAKNLGIPLVIVENASRKTADQIASNMHLVYDSFHARDLEVLLCVANKVDESEWEHTQRRLEADLGSQTLPVAIPELPRLSRPSLQEIMKVLDGRVLQGEALLGNQADAYLVGAMQLRHYLPLLTENCLPITPGDRADIILGTMQAHASSNYPRISGMVLTGGIEPDEPVLRILEGQQNIPPLILTALNTFEAANLVGDMPSRILPADTAKIELGITIFERYVDVNLLEQKIVAFHSEAMTPHMFQYNLVKKARKRRMRIVLPESGDDRILTAASRLSQQDVVEVLLLGSPPAVEAAFQRLGLPQDPKIQVIDPAASPWTEPFAQALFELRRHKNLTLDAARDLMGDPNYFGTMMVQLGHADGMVSGAVHTTQATIRPALQIIKTRPGIDLVSSVFFMCLENRVSVFGDCAVNPNPTAEQLADIAISSADTSQAFGIPPRVAMLSYSSGQSGKGEEVEKVRKAVELVRSRRPEVLVEGPIQYDAAVDPGVARSKMPGSAVAGQASVLIFPDLNTGNNTYKAVQRETGAIAIGPMLQGLNKPINDLSRGCTVEDIFNTVVITAIQAQESQV